MAPWKVEATTEDFERVRTDERFAALLSLGRTANLLRSTLSLAMPHDEAPRTVANRSMMSATLLVTGFVAEALGSLERYARHWKSLPAYAEFVVPLTTDPVRKSLTGQWLRPLRNQAVFHNDPVVTIESLKLMTPTVPQVLAEGTTETIMDVYYPASDAIAIIYLVQNAGATAAPMEFINASVASLISYARRTCEALDAIVLQGFSQLGFKWSDSDSLADER
jgi:hypothetical protein